MVHLLELEEAQHIRDNTRSTITLDLEGQIIGTRLMKVSQIYTAVLKSSIHLLKNMGNFNLATQIQTHMNNLDLLQHDNAPTLTPTGADSRSIGEGALILDEHGMIIVQEYITNRQSAQALIQATIKILKKNFNIETLATQLEHWFEYTQDEEISASGNYIDIDVILEAQYFHALLTVQDPYIKYRN